jgi:hypothetical protein
MTRAVRRLLLPCLLFVLCAALAWGPEAGQSAPHPSRPSTSPTPSG